MSYTRTCRLGPGTRVACPPIGDVTLGRGGVVGGLFPNILPRLGRRREGRRPSPDEAGKLYVTTVTSYYQRLSEPKAPGSDMRDVFEAFLGGGLVLAVRYSRAHLTASSAPGSPGMVESIVALAVPREQ